MIFGRRKNQTEKDEVLTGESDELFEAESADDSDELESVDDQVDEWDRLDKKNWREAGPFDITEVDLDADDIVRLDLGSLVLTPFEGMQIQLQMDEETQRVNALLVMKEDSAIEVALFAAPKISSMVSEVRKEMVADTTASGGEATLAEGPFGTEIRRVLPVVSPEGQQLLHISRTWLVQGPRWLLRGVLMGGVGQRNDLEGVGLELFEFFANIVVRRGGEPAAAGDVIAMTLPEGIVQQ